MQIVGGIHVVRVQFCRVLITLDRLLPGFLHRVQAFRVRLEFEFALAIQRVAQIVIRLLLQLQIRRQGHRLKIVQRLVKICGAIRRRARVEDQTQVVGVDFGASRSNSSSAFV